MLDTHEILVGRMAGRREEEVFTKHLLGTKEKNQPRYSFIHRQVVKTALCQTVLGPQEPTS